jgi:1-acyl-sn-glycerol-3-phosphate acyltransferase
MVLLRSIAFLAYFYAVTIALALAAPFLRLRGWRGALRHARLWSMLVLDGVRVICGIRYEVTGREHLPAHGPALIACMHQSAFETFAWLQIAPEVTFVVKQELARIPIVGGLMRQGGLIVVDRSGGSAAMRRAMSEARAAAAGGRQIVIFPEGTRVAPGRFVKLQPGVAGIASATNLPVIPVATDSGLFWGRRALLKYPGTIHIAIMPAIPPGTSRNALLRALETAFATGSAALGVPVENSVSSAPHNLARKSS